jgi:hypothetical protein
VRGVALLLLVWLVAGCGPDYAHSAFRCDATHGCPSGQSCISERCRRGVPEGATVDCGAAICDVATQQCCIDGINAPRCIAAGDVCPGVGALCDGREDCIDRDRCCADDDTIACFESCKDYACRDDDDCPSTAPNCCATAQLGVCLEIRC